MRLFALICVLVAANALPSPTPPPNSPPASTNSLPLGLSAFACFADVDQYCANFKNVNENGLQSLMLCLRQHKDSLSSPCLAGLGQTPQFNCVEDEVRFCSSKSGVELEECMKLHSTELSQDCKLAPSKPAGPFQNECADDISQFCSQVGNDRRALHKCMKKNRSQLSPACKSALKAFRREHKRHHDRRRSGHGDRHERPNEEDNSEEFHGHHGRHGGHHRFPILHAIGAVFVVVLIVAAFVACRRRRRARREAELCAARVEGHMQAQMGMPAASAPSASVVMQMPPVSASRVAFGNAYGRLPEQEI